MKFDSYHPMVHVMYFITVIVSTVYCNHPIFIGISYVASFLYSCSLNRKKGILFGGALVFVIPIYALWYSYYNHFGITNLGENIIGNEMTLEALLYGIERGVTIVTIIMWFSCLHNVFTSDKVMYLLGRVTPKLSLYFSIILREVPRIFQMIGKVHMAQQGIGRGVNQGHVWSRGKNLIRYISILFTWIIDNLMETTVSMRSRGYGLRGRKAYSIYRFDNRDRGFVLILFTLIIIFYGAILLEQTCILYNPEIVWNRITTNSIFFYVGYIILCFIPMIIEEKNKIVAYMRKSIISEN